VAPGFIDDHTNDDASLIARSDMKSKLSQGVTMAICSNYEISGLPKFICSSVFQALFG